jgi:beta-glucosidase/6-phospho-beta-glucosidase/beta-galactosidase
MRNVGFLTLALTFVALPSAFSFPDVPDTVVEGAFPADFNFGTSTSSYQVEGGWLDGGKGFSIWDAYSHIPGMIANGDTGDVANDMYHLYPSDIQLMAKQGLHHYRFSIAWNRIMPTGVAPVNQQGVDYYNDLINQLLANGIQPHVTLYHSETPLALTLYPNLPMPFMDSDRFPSWFSNYTDTVFSLFGDRVKHWFTFNEPFCTSVYGTYGDTVSIVVTLFFASSARLTLPALFTGSLPDRPQRDHRARHHGEQLPH